MNIFISHTVGCTGWKMDEIYKNTNFKIACRTTRFSKKDIGKVKMLDWEYLEWKKRPEKVKQRHWQLTQENHFEVVMSMDVWRYNLTEAIEFYETLKADNVYIPVHYYHKELLAYDLAYPNANWFSKNLFPPVEYRKNIKHILGGSPQSQVKLIRRNYFPNLKSIDGNQIFNLAIRAGKYWSHIKPYWHKPKNKETNEEIFKRSVFNLNEIIERY